MHSPKPMVTQLAPVKTKQKAMYMRERFIVQKRETGSGGRESTQHYNHVKYTYEIIQE